MKILQELSILKWVWNINVVFCIIIIKMSIMRYLLLLFVFLSVITTVSAQVLKGGVSHVPDMLFGSWRVVSIRVETDAPASFKEKGIDLWNISLEDDVIKLCNPFSKAAAEVKVEEAGLNHVVFTKDGKYNNKLLTDSVSINIKGDTFTGSNTLSLKTLSDVDGSVIKTETAKYSLTGERISGQSVKGN